MKYLVNYDLVDSYGRSIRKTYETKATMASFEDALTAASALAGDLKAITGAQILAYTVSYRVTYTDTVVAGSNRDEGATLVLRKEDNRKATMRVPAPINTIFDGNGNVSIVDTGVTGYTLNFMSGGNFTLSDGEQAVQLLSGTLDK